MARPLRIDFAGAFHHVTNRGARGQRTFIDSEDRWDFCDLLQKTFTRFGIVVHAYCFMDNHFHLIVETPHGNLSRGMHLIESCYVQRFNRRHETNGPLYQDRFYSKLIEADGYLRQAILYVIRNPDKAGMVDNLSEYPWSCYPYFLGPKTEIPDWLSAEGLRMGGIANSNALRQAVESSDPKNEIDLDDYPQVIGSDSFIASALELAELDEETVGHHRRARIRPTYQEIESAICAIFEEKPPRILGSSQGKSAPGRMVAVLLAQELAGHSLAAIAERYGFGNRQSAGAIATRCRKLIASDPVLELRVEQVRQVLADGRPRD